MKTVKYILFVFVFLIILVKEVGFTAFVNAWRETRKVLGI